MRAHVDRRQTWSASSRRRRGDATGTGVGAAIAVRGATTIAIGLSLVSLDGARANLAAEVPAIDFDAVARGDARRVGAASSTS